MLLEEAGKRGACNWKDLVYIMAAVVFDLSVSGTWQR